MSPRRRCRPAHSAFGRASLAALGLLTVLFGTPAQARDPAEYPASESQFLIAPYLYGMSVRGKIGLGNQVAPIDVGPEDIAGGINAAGMGYVMWTDPKQFIYAEGLGARWSDDSFDQFYDQPVKAQLALFEMGYGRHFYAETVAPAEGVMTVSPYLGLRYAQIDFKVPNQFQPLNARESWLDPVAGVIIEAPLLGPINYALKADAAGFGLGRDHYWSFTAAARYLYSKHWTALFGYRVARFNARPGGDNIVRFELRGSGPEGGITYAF